MGKCVGGAARLRAIMYMMQRAHVDSRGVSVCGSPPRESVGRERACIQCGESTVFATVSAALVVLQSFCLMGLQCGDSWFTAIYFHTPAETMIALVLGLLACQAVTIGMVIIPAASALELAVIALRESRNSRLG